MPLSITLLNLNNTLLHKALFMNHLSTYNPEKWSGWTQTQAPIGSDSQLNVYYVSTQISLALLTSCYLINCTPSSVLNHRIPFQIVFPDRPLHPLPPQTFGCVCFVHVIPFRKNKVSPKSIKCVFICYSKTQKGYCCYHPNGCHILWRSSLLFVLHIHLRFYLSITYSYIWFWHLSRS